MISRVGMVLIAAVLALALTAAEVPGGRVDGRVREIPIAAPNPIRPAVTPSLGFACQGGPGGSNSSITGTVSPTYASVSIADQFVPVQALGKFSCDVPPGKWWVNASATGYMSFNQTESVGPHMTVNVPITLQANPGWINGTVEPLGSSVSVDGRPVHVNVFGVFNVSAGARIHTVNATMDGYDEIDQLVIVPAGGTAFINFSLNKSGNAPLLSIPQIIVIGIAVAGAIAVVALLVVRRRGRPKPAPPPEPDPEPRERAHRSARSGKRRSPG